MLPGQCHMWLTTMRVLASVVEPWRLELIRGIWLNAPLMATNFTVVNYVVTPMPEMAVLLDVKPAVGLRDRICHHG